MAIIYFSLQPIFRIIATLVERGKIISLIQDIFLRYNTYQPLAMEVEYMATLDILDNIINILPYNFKLLQYHILVAAIFMLF